MRHLDYLDWPCVGMFPSSGHPGCTRGYNINLYYSPWGAPRKQLMARGGRARHRQYNQDCSQCVQATQCYPNTCSEASVEFFQARTARRQSGVAIVGITEYDALCGYSLHNPGAFERKYLRNRVNTHRFNLHKRGASVVEGIIR
jgi:hypothetical protein